MHSSYRRQYSRDDPRESVRSRQLQEKDISVTIMTDELLWGIDLRGTRFNHCRPCPILQPALGKALPPLLPEDEILV